MVAQLGARMHFAVPRILHAAGRLSHLFTDICASRGLISWLNAWPTTLRPGAIRRLLSRQPKNVPSELISAYTTLGMKYAWDFARTKTESERVRLFLRVGQEFGAWVLRQDWSNANGVFVYNTAGLEILHEARRRGLRTVVEQTIAPYAYEHKILREERDRFPLWEVDSGPVPERDQYIAREQAEWELSDTILCGLEFVREGISACGGPTHRCVVVPYGVDGHFEKLERPRHSGPLRVLTVGAVSLRKGTPYVIEVARRMKGRAQFRWVGAFKMSPQARTELGGDVEFTGAVPRSDVVRHYAWADVFLLPSLCEGSATATYEALTSGLPVVCTPNTGSIVRDGADGFVVPIRDVDALEERLLELAANSERRGEMSQCAAARAAEFDFDAYAKALLAAFDDRRGVVSR